MATRLEFATFAVNVLALIAATSAAFIFEAQLGEMIKAERPWVGFLDPVSMPINQDKQREITINLNNTGKTPARDARAIVGTSTHFGHYIPTSDDAHRVFLMVRDVELDKLQDDPTLPSDPNNTPEHSHTASLIGMKDGVITDNFLGSILPAQTLTIPPIVGIFESDITLVLYGSVHYKDAMSADRVTNFCDYAFSNTGHSLVFHSCSVSNDVQ